VDHSASLPPKYRHRAKDLTPERVKVLRHLVRFEDENLYPPSLRELAQQLGCRSHTTVYAHLENLERQGLVQRLPRNIRPWRSTGGGRSLLAA
jgi:repressor LexA